MHGELAAQGFEERGVDLGVVEAGHEGLALERRHFDPEARHRLRRLDAERPQPQNGRSLRKGLLFEERIGRQQPPREPFPAVRHDRARPGRQDDASGANLPSADHDSIGTE